MNKIKILSKSPKQTMTVAKDLAKYLGEGDIICLDGELGSGKTTFVKGLAEGLRINPTEANSPTFTLLQIYEGTLPIYHFDLYRLENPKEIEAIGYEEFFYGDGICVVEWAGRLGRLAPQEYLQIQFEHVKEGERLLQLKANGKRYEEILKEYSV